MQQQMPPISLLSVNASEVKSEMVGMRWPKTLRRSPLAFQQEINLYFRMFAMGSLGSACSAVLPWGATAWELEESSEQDFLGCCSATETQWLEALSDIEDVADFDCTIMLASGNCDDEKQFWNGTIAHRQSGKMFSKFSYTMRITYPFEEGHYPAFGTKDEPVNVIVMKRISPTELVSEPIGMKMLMEHFGKASFVDTIVAGLHAATSHGCLSGLPQNAKGCVMENFSETRHHIGDPQLFADHPDDYLQGTVVFRVKLTSSGTREHILDCVIAHQEAGVTFGPYRCTFELMYKESEVLPGYTSPGRRVFF